MYGYGLESMTDAIDELQGGIDYFSAQVDVNLNMDLKGRTTETILTIFHKLFMVMAM